MNTKTRVGALFLIFSLVNISFAQKIPPIDSMNDSVNTNSKLDKIYKDPQSFEELRDQTIYIAKIKPNLLIKKLMGPALLLSINSLFTDYDYHRRSKNIVQNSRYYDLKNLEKKLILELEELSKDLTPPGELKQNLTFDQLKKINAMNKSEFDSFFNTLKKAAIEERIAVFQRINLIAEQLSQHELIELDEYFQKISDQPNQASNSNLRTVTARTRKYIKFGESMLNAVEAKSQGVTAHVRNLELGANKIHLASWAAGLFYMTWLTIEYFATPVENQADRTIGQISDLEMMDMLKMMTDPEGLGLTFAEAGRALMMANNN